MSSYSYNGTDLDNIFEPAFSGAVYTRADTGFAQNSSDLANRYQAIGAYTNWEGVDIGYNVNYNELNGSDIKGAFMPIGSTIARSNNNSADGFDWAQWIIKTDGNHYGYSDTYGLYNSQRWMKYALNQQYNVNISISSLDATTYSGDFGTVDLGTQRSVLLYANSGGPPAYMNLNVSISSGWDNVVRATFTVSLTASNVL